MAETISSITFAGEEAPLVNADAITEDDLLTVGELNQFLLQDLNAPDDSGLAIFSTEDGSYYIVGSVNGESGLKVSGVVEAEDANDCLGLIDD